MSIRMYSVERNYTDQNDVFFFSKREFLMSFYQVGHEGLFFKTVTSNTHL